MTQNVNDLEMNLEDEPLPEFVELSPSFEALIENVTATDCNLQSGHYNTAIHLLSLILFKMYGSTDIEKLCSESSTEGSVKSFSVALSSVIEEQQFKQSTKRTTVYAIKKILSKTSVCRSLIEQSSTKSAITKPERNDVLNAFPGKWKHFKTDTLEYKAIISWIDLIRKKTRIKSFSTIRQLLYFVSSVLENVELSILHAEQLTRVSKDKLNTLIKSNQNKYHIRAFLKAVFNYDVDVDIPTQSKDVVKLDHDIHRISAEEMEKMYEVTKNDVRTRLILLFFCTTGMRIGGLVNIKLQHVCKDVDGQTVINDTGRTIEKNNKWFTFTISPQLKTAMWDWIVNKRRNDPSNEYLFAGRGGPLSTNRVREIIKEVATKAELKGDHLHPHSFRHSFAHILLECGNSIDNISKMIGHASSKTTEAYYLKESAAEVSKRSNIPWLQNQPKTKVVPNFLTNNVPTKKTDDEKQQRRQRRKNLKSIGAQLRDVTSTLPTIIEE